MTDAANAAFLLLVIAAILAWEWWCYKRGGWDAMLSGTIRRMQKRWRWFCVAVAVVFFGFWVHWFLKE